jgi:ABC-type transport system involved in multi-copper enzyme maturation permease subunit
LRFFTLGQLVSFIGNEVVSRFGAAVAMMLSCILTAFFIPHMLAKGTIDLLLSKPVNRVTLFIYKFLGGMTFMLVNTTVIMVGVWFGVGIQAGMWINSFLLCIAIFTFQFAIFYSVSALAGVMTRSPLVAIFAVISLWGILTASGYAYWIAIEQYQGQTSAVSLLESGSDRNALETGIEIFHAALPRYKEIDWLTAKIIKRDLILSSSDSSTAAAQQRESELKELDRSTGSYTWTASLGVSAAFILLMVGLSTWWFATRNY